MNTRSVKSESPEDRLREHPKERLAAPVQMLTLAESVAKLRAEPHAPVAGHRQVALVRRGPVTIILFVFEADGVLKEHKTDGEVIVQVLRGRLAVTVDDEAFQLAEGELIAIAPGRPHAVHALGESEMLLTICQVAAGSGTH